MKERYAYPVHELWCWLEACPQYDGDNYIGPQAIAQGAVYSKCTPAARGPRDQRLEGLMGEDGTTNCGKRDKTA